MCANEIVSYSEFFEMKICFSLKVDNACFKHGIKRQSRYTGSE